MAWFNRQKKGADTAGMSINSADNVLSRLLSGVLGARTSSGVDINNETALRQGAVWACISLLTDTIGTLPLNIMRLEGDDYVKDNDHPLNALLKVKPNSFMSPTDFKGSIVSGLCLNGVFFAEKGRDTRSEIAAINPLNQSKISQEVKNGVVSYKYDGQSVSDEELVIVRGFSTDGLTPMSPISYARESIALSAVSEKHGASFFKNGGYPSMYVETPKQLTPEQREALKTSMRNNYQGAENAGEIMLLELGMKAGALGLSNTDAQYIESRQMSVSDIARIFRVPPHMIGDLMRSTNNNIEHQGIDFVRYSLNPYFKRIEEWLQMCLFSPADRMKYKIKFNPEALLRGDIKTRSEAYSKQVTSGIMTINEARKKENLRPVEGGDELRVQAQMTSIQIEGTPTNAN